MMPHTKIYMAYFDYKGEEFIPCEACGRKAVDIHHIDGRGKGKNVIKNLMAVCRKCHDRIHNTGEISKGEAQYIHNNFLVGNKLSFMK
jgi:predicted restriction endonuclease